ncbi:MAG TPA: ribosome-associated translation inhibitor RaiA [Thermoanaerobaculia bacterium]|nr:ribosome-associated translation inhibitor RaiA [Thermoanaerobaculia bacterium]
MGVQCTGRNVEVTPLLRALAEERTQRLERHLGGPARVRVVLSHEKHRFEAEVIATHRRRRWTAQEETGDARAAVTLAFEKIDAQAMKDSEKRRARKHRGAGAIALPEGEGGGETPAPRRARPQRRIVRAGRRIAAKPMTVEEGAMRLEGSREDHLVFRDSTSEKISILYRRSDGDFGLIVPEC